jgi:two-component system, response regulator
MNARKILLVEDNPSDVDLTRRALDKHHIANQLIVAEDGQEALDMLLGVGTAEDLPALVLLDLKLPKVSGLEVLKDIRADKRTRRIPVVILTTSKQEEDVAMSYDQGANSYIRKPVDFEHFAEAVRHLGLYWLVLNEPPPKMDIPKSEAKDKD